MLRLLIEKVKLAVQKRTGAGLKQKTYADWLAKGYNDEPEVTFVIESHNKSVQVCHVVEKLRRWQPGRAELIVIDDGSTLEHTQRLAAMLTGANELLLRANDLYENRTYDKALHMARGRLVALMQDDDDFADTRWVDEAVGLFDAHPRLAILGGNWALRMEFDDAKRWGHGMHDEQTEAKGGFQLAESVNRAPMWVRRDLFLEHLKHIDAVMAPFQYDDDELCLRAWLCGLQVGWYDARFHSLAAGGMRLWNGGIKAEQCERNGHRLYELYAHRMEEVRQALNIEL